MIQLRPSSAHIWSFCDANPLMASRVPPEQPSDPAREGTCAAWVAELVLTGQAPNTKSLVGRSHENGWLITDEMASYIAGYIETVKTHGGQIHTERKVRLNNMIEGTPDAFAVLDHGILYADDLKYGFGIVEPFQNHQVSIYAGAILRMLNARSVTISRVVIGVYQPRAWHPAGIYRTWSITPEKLMSFVQGIEAAGVRAQVPNPKATPGSHCHYCPAAMTCAAVAHENYRVHEYLCADQQRHMTTGELANELAFLELAEDMLTGRKRAVHAEVEARMRRAEFIPGWHLEERRGNRRFKFPAPVIKALTGINPEVPKMVTPAELEKMGAPVKLVAKLTETPRIDPKLKRVAPGFYNNLFTKKEV